jgi:hypothetical protein
MSFRRLVHLVVDDMGIRRTYSLRSIDMCPAFSAAPHESPPVAVAVVRTSHRRRRRRIMR